MAGSKSTVLPGAALASVIAWRSDPAPESAVVVTVRVAPRCPLDLSSRHLLAAPAEHWRAACASPATIGL